MHGLGRRSLSGVAAGDGADPCWEERLALTLVGVSTCDLDAVILHQPLPTHRRMATADRQAGLEGPVSGVVRVTSPHRLGPAPVSVTLPPEHDGGTTAAHSEPADWFGHARFLCSVRPVAGATGYRVARAAAVAAVFDRDRAARQGGVAPYDDGPFDDDGASGRGWPHTIHNSTSMTSRPISRRALTPRRSPPPGAIGAPGSIRPSSTGRSWRWLSCRATKRCSARRTRGDRSAPVHRPARRPRPRALRLSHALCRRLGQRERLERSIPASRGPGRDRALDAGAAGPRAGENRITAEWLTGTEPDLAAYRVWRADTEQALADVRRLAPLATCRSPPGAGRPTQTNRCRADEHRLSARRSHAAGNVSRLHFRAVAVAVDTDRPIRQLGSARRGPAAACAWSGARTRSC